MAKKETTKNIDASTIVVNDELTNDPTVTNDSGCPPTGDCSDPNHECKCKPGHCPNKNCSSGHYWTEGTKNDKYLYHYDDDTETKLEDADHRKSNPKYEEPKKPEIVVPQPQPVTPNDCGPEVAEPWAHDELLKDEDGQVAISNRIFEIWFYNLFIAQDAIDSKTYDAGQQLKGQFVTESGLDVEKILK